MKKKKSATTLKLIAATSLAIFSLLVSFSGAVAWFSMNKNVNNSGAGMRISRLENTVSEIFVFEYLGLSTDGNYFCFNKTINTSGPNQNKITFTSHNPEDVTINAKMVGKFSISDPHHPLLIVIKLSEKSNATMRVRTDSLYVADDSFPTFETTVASYAALMALNTSGYNGGEYVKVTSDEHIISAEEPVENTIYKYVYDAEEEEGEFVLVWKGLGSTNPLSSVIKSYSFDFDADGSGGFSSLYNATALSYKGYTDDELDADATAVGAGGCIALSASTYSGNNFVSFASFDSNGIYTGFDDEITLHAGGADHDYVAIMIDYLEPAIFDISYHFLGNEYLMDGLHFACDWITYV